MNYKQYTRCISAGGYVPLFPKYLILLAPAVLLGFWALGPAIGLGILLAIIGFCRWWLYGRLICLGGDRCAVGLLLGIERPEDKSLFNPPLDKFDTDYSVTMLLAPSRGIDPLPDILAGFQGYLIQETDTTRKRGLPFTGVNADTPTGIYAGAPLSDEIRHVPALHCEFEGGGIYDLYLAALAAYGVAAVASVVCFIPVIGWVVCAILWLIALAILAGGMLVALNDKGSPTDVNPDIGNLERLNDVLVIKGAWVYDSLHTGWNEIHPIKACNRIGRWNDWHRKWPDNIRDLAQQWCAALDKADSPATHTAQRDPAQRWELHPLIDSCDSGGGSGTIR